MGILTNSRNPERPDALFQFTNGVDVDRHLAVQEVQVQKAWARALVDAGVLTTQERDTVLSALDQAASEVQAGRFEWRIQDEDVHMNLERFVTEKAGILGKKMHVGRSRNDLIATTLRLFVRDTLLDVQAGLDQLIRALAAQAEKHMDVIIPGTTHLQNGQPVRFAHALVGHAMALKRDAARIQDAGRRAMESMPLGSAALAGTTLSIDLAGIAKELGFQGPTKNSYDSVGDRDFVAESLSALGLMSAHLSRLSEDFIIWASTPMGLVKLPKQWSTGSSIMPNKRNPDVAELTRAKSAHVIAAATEAQVLLKGMPTSYGSDLHEIKQIYLRAFKEVQAIFSVLPFFVRDFGVDEARARELLEKGHVFATEIADELALNQAVPFREAYSQVASLVEAAEDKGVQVHQLPIDVAQKIAPKLSSSFLKNLTAEACVEKRAGSGGTAKKQILSTIQDLRT